jgi:hypothetical protein
VHILGVSTSDNFPSREDPAGGRRKLPQAPGNPRKAPAQKALLFPQIPANSRSSRKRHDRPVTPEVAGSSPVAPVNPLQSGIFWGRSWRKRPPAFFIPRSSRTGNSRREPPGAANPRRADDRHDRRASSNSRPQTQSLGQALLCSVVRRAHRPSSSYAIEGTTTNRSTSIYSPGRTGGLKAAWNDRTEDLSASATGHGVSSSLCAARRRARRSPRPAGHSPRSSRKCPAPAGNSVSQPAVAGCPVPACHAGGRGFESRRSRKSPAKRHIVRSVRRQICADYTYALRRATPETASPSSRGRRQH